MSAPDTKLGLLSEEELTQLLNILRLGRWEKTANCFRIHIATQARTIERQEAFIKSMEGCGHPSFVFADVLDEKNKEIANLREAIGKAEEVMKQASRRLWEHHEMGYCEKIERQHSCHVCEQEPNIFETIESAIAEIKKGQL